MRSHFAICLALLASSADAADPPRVVRENIEWLDVWVPGNNTKGLPRVLLVGDSITRGYYKTVEDQLKGKAIVCRLTTSKSVGDPGLLAEVKLVLGQYAFDVVHFNNGLHGWGYSEEEYAKALPELVRVIQADAPRAKLIWATTTPVREPDKLEKISAKTERVIARNQIATRLMANQKIPTNDLYALVIDHPEWHGRDGTHFNAKGTTAEGEAVARSILAILSPTR